MFKIGDEIFDFNAPDEIGIVTKIDVDSFTGETRVWADWQPADGGGNLWIPLESARHVVSVDDDVAAAILTLTNAGYRVTIEKI